MAALVANAHASLRWLTGERRDEAEAVAAVQRIARDAERASEIIGGIRRFLGRTGTHREPVDLVSIVRDVVTLVGPYARANTIELDVDVTGAVPLVMADRVQIEQVVVNLVTNAIEAVGAAAVPAVVRVTAGTTGLEAWSGSRTEDRGSRARSTRSSSPSPPRKPMAWAWVSPSAGRSPTHTEGGSRSSAPARTAP
ncbi:MAG: hypothetical protein R2713_04370 [Ilumatobacteraceae bacterium]